MKETRRQRDVDDYETLRREALLIGLGQGGERLPFGLAGWLAAVPPTAPLPLQRLPSETSGLAEAPSRGSLTAAVASIVFRLTQEAAYA